MNRHLLLGKEAPDGVGQLTVEQALAWGQPCQWLLETCKMEVMNTVGRGVERSLEHVMVAMLSDWSGYSPAAIVGHFRAGDQLLLSDSGAALAEVARGTRDATHLGRATEYWREAIATNVPDGLLGFGHLAAVENLEPGLWAQLTLETLQLTSGRIGRPHTVADRAAKLEPSSITLDIMNRLVRGTAGLEDSYLVAKSANSLLDTAINLADREEYKQLRTALSERGLHKDANFHVLRGCQSRPAHEQSHSVVLVLVSLRGVFPG